MYWNIRHEIPGEGAKKGFRFGTATALLWLAAMLEGVSLFGNSIQNEFIVGLSDAVPVFALSMLLSLLRTEKAQSGLSAAFVFKQKIRAISIFTGIFLTGRYIAYFSGAIRSGIQTRPLHTFLWTLLMGITIGTAFVLIDSNKNLRSVKHRVIKFGFFIFGLNWAAFLLFMPLLFSGYLIDVLSRIAVDILLVTGGCFFTLYPERKPSEKQVPEQFCKKQRLER